MTRLYGEFFRFPYLVYVASLHTFAISALAALVGRCSPARSSPCGRRCALTPAVAMAPPLPVRIRRHAIDRLGDLLGLPTTARMILRSLTRWPGRAAFTLFGVAASVAILVGSLFTFDAVEFLIDESLFRANRQHATLTLNEARTAAAVIEVARNAGRARGRGRAGGAGHAAHGPVERRASLEGRHAAATVLAGCSTPKAAPVAMPDHGLLMSDKLARQLGVGPGAVLEVEFMDGARETRRVPLAGTVRLHYGEGVYMDAGALAALRLTGREINLVHISVDAGGMPALNAAVKATPGIAGMTLWTEVRAQLPRYHGREPGDLDHRLLRLGRSSPSGSSTTPPASSCLSGRTNSPACVSSGSAAARCPSCCWASCWDWHCWRFRLAACSATASPP